MPLSTVMNVGLVFEVVSCYGISLAEYLEPTRLNFNGWIGLSWVGSVGTALHGGDPDSSSQGDARDVGVADLGSRRHRLHGPDADEPPISPTR